MNPKDILLEHLINSYNCSDIIDSSILQHTELIAMQAFKSKGVFTVLTTLLVYKCLFPEQDVRLHQSHMKGGFSGRIIDTKYITPTLKAAGLPAMAESGWLTRSLEQPEPYSLTYPGKITAKGVKEAFLNLLDHVEGNPEQASPILRHLLYKVQELKNSSVIEIKKVYGTSITIDQALSFLKEQFSYSYETHGGSKLPVLAFYTAYEVLVEELKRFEGMELKSLGSHTASDLTSKCAGDIEIYKAGKLFEAVEIKFGKFIDAHTVHVAKEKIYKYHPERYYILSDAGVKQEQECQTLCQHILDEHGCQVVINGLYPTLKYYFRLISSLEVFLNKYIERIETDTELQTVHKIVCKDLVEKHFYTAKASS